MEQSVTLSQMLDARESRAWRQQRLLDEYHSPLVCFTMNIAGPVKNSPLIRRAFELGVRRLLDSLNTHGIRCIHQEMIHEVTGNEAFFVVDADPLLLKKITAGLEDEAASAKTDGLKNGISSENSSDTENKNISAKTDSLKSEPSIGRLFDLDVIRPDGRQVSRTELGLPQRLCLICGNPAKDCARSRRHTVAELQEKTRSILQNAIDKIDNNRTNFQSAAGQPDGASSVPQDGISCDIFHSATMRPGETLFASQEQEEIPCDIKKAADLACRAILYEVATTPKPGLVDRANCGSHRDMDFFSFMDSASVLWPYFRECAEIGRRTALQPAPETLSFLRQAGQRAEADMFAATNGVNTHKGAIFSVGILCGALGRLPEEHWKNPKLVLDECAAITKGIVAVDFAGLTLENAKTAGQKFYLKYGITGVRGQMEAGLPAVREAGLPVLREGIAQGLSINDAGCAALLALITASTDTNIIARGGIKIWQETVSRLKTLLAENPYPNRETLETLDREFQEKNLSPGGSADLLAICYLLYFLEKEK